VKKVLFPLIMVSLVAFVLGGILASDGVDQIKNLLADNDSIRVSDKKQAYTVAKADTSQTMSIADIAEISSPAVVNLEVSSKLSNPMFNNPFYRQFYGRNEQNLPQQVQEGIGSGFLISSDGYIITNQHVIDGAETITVTVSGYDEKQQAYVVGEDYDLDLAVIKISGSGYPALELGISAEIRVGESVVAIGQPYGLDHTVTTGVISAKERPITIEDRQYVNLIQTDAAINPGNSGGPLLNMQGQVIGINTAINSEAQGIGFAIPIDTVTEVLDSLLSGSKIEKAFMGVSMTDATEEVVLSQGLPAETVGALIAGVVEDGPAEKAGILSQDVIVAIDNSRIKSASDLQNAIQSRKAGDKIAVSLLRQGQEINLSLQLQAKS